MNGEKTLRKSRAILMVPNQGHLILKTAPEWINQFTVILDVYMIYTDTVPFYQYGGLFQRSNYSLAMLILAIHGTSCARLGIGKAGAQLQLEMRLRLLRRGTGRRVTATYGVSHQYPICDHLLVVLKLFSLSISSP